MKTFTFPSERILLARLDRGDDLLEALTALCEAERIEVGTLQAIGAVERAVVGYYDQTAGHYEELVFEEGLEIASLTANVSIKDGAPFVHAHVTLSDAQGRCVGGHLMPGTRVFACELALRVFTGTPPVRGLDEATQLALW